MKIERNTLVFTGNGKPRLVLNANQTSYESTEDLSQIQKNHPRGIKNFDSQEIHEKGRALIEDIRTESQSTKESIDKLNHLIQELEAQSSSKELIHYLKSELHYQMLYHRHVPEKISTSLKDL